MRLRPAKKPRTNNSLLSKAVVLVCAALFFGAAWATVAPRNIGGPASYVVTDGVSMLPHFKANGLVITRAESNYHVGEVVAYHNRQLGKVVMHRIVAMAGDRYIFKGDNNSSADQYHPKKSEIVGKEWVYWPGGGRYLNMLRNPLTFAIVIGLVTLIALLPSRRNRHRRRHHA